MRPEVRRYLLLSVVFGEGLLLGAGLVLYLLGSKVPAHPTTHLISQATTWILGAL
jgi:hypothetical protein